MRVRRGSTILQAFRWTGGADQEEDPNWAGDAARTGQLWFEEVGTP